MKNSLSINNMLQNRKSQVFILMALAIASILVISFGTYSFTNDRSALNQRINTMNSFLSSAEKDISRQLYIAAYRAVFLAETGILEEGCVSHYTEDNSGSCITSDNPLEDLLSEMFFNDTVRCDVENVPGCLDEKSLIFGIRRIDLIQDNTNSLQKKAAELNINVNTCPGLTASPSPPANPSPTECGYDITVAQSDPWHIKIIFSFNLNITDKDNLASWNKRESVESLVPIANFYDPLYITETNTYGSKIAKTPYMNEDESFDSTKIKEEMEKGYYIEDSNAPNFLMRLAKNKNSNQYGVSRLIDVSALMNQGIDVSSYTGNSIVDYQFFSGVEGTCQVPNQESWFKLDSAHADLYGVSC